MRVLIINTDYPNFLAELYSVDEHLASAPYAAQMCRRNESLFGVADFYSRNFRALGHEAWEVHANNRTMQEAWLSAHSEVSRGGLRWARLKKAAARCAARMSHALPGPLARPARSIEYRLLESETVPRRDVLVEQARHLRPDVILNQAVAEIGSDVLLRMRAYARLVVGQIASPLPEHESYRAYDLMISSLPNFVRHYRDRGIDAELNRLAFEPSVLEAVGRIEPSIPVSFVGSLTPSHPSRIDLLEHLAQTTEIRIWSDGLDSIRADSPIRSRHQGLAWGRDMFAILGRSRVTVNHHIGIAEDYANNMRLFEATGMGALLVTDWKSNVRDLFEPGKEIVCYRTHEECTELIRYYLAHEDERAVIARAGQARTLQDHTYRQRVTELADLFERRFAAQI